MKIIQPRIEVVKFQDYSEMLRIVEAAARTCYKSEDKACNGSAEKLIRACINRGHESVIEHVGATMRFVCDRGVSHELVRHRLCSFSQESTRYVRYDGDMEFVEPWWWNEATEEKQRRYAKAWAFCEVAYKDSIDAGDAPQAARAVLPNAMKTEVVTTANIREWRHIFKLRCDKAAHPDMVRIMKLAFDFFKKSAPVFFEDSEF